MFESSLYHGYFYHVQLIEHESYARFKIVCKVQTWGAFQILRVIQTPATRKQKKTAICIGRLALVMNV